MHSVNQSNTFGSENFYIQYLNTILNNPSHQIKSLSELSDGIQLHEILSGLKQFQIDPIMSQSATFVCCLNNLKTIVKAIQKYWVEEIGVQCDHDIELIHVAKNKPHQQTKKLVKLVIKTLFHSFNKDQYIEKVLSTSQQTQQFFMHLLNEETIKSQSHKSTSKPQQLYGKLLELESQNEQLLQIIQQLQQRNSVVSKKYKDSKDKIQERDIQIKRLAWEINDLHIKTVVYNEQLIAEEQRQNSNRKLVEQIKQLEEREKIMIEEMQKMRILLEANESSFKKIKRIESQFEIQREEKMKLKQRHDKIQVELLQNLVKGQQISKRLDEALLTIEQNSTQNSTLKSELSGCQQQLSLKQQIIDQLENNIKYLIQTEKQQSTIPARETSNSIKEECKEIIQKQNFDKMSQAIILRLKRENQMFTQQLQQAIKTNQKLEKELQRLILFEDQNKKLVQMISHMHKYRGEENQVLMHCLYRMRMKLLGKQMLSQIHTQTQKPLTEINRNY